MSTELHDFKDGNGPVRAARHCNGGGWVACTARVHPSAQVFGNALVFGNAWVAGNAQVFGNALVFGNAWVAGDAQVSGDAQVYGDALVSGNAWVSGNAQVSGDAQVYGDALVSGNAWVSGDALVGVDAQVSPIFVSGLSYPITITDHHLCTGRQVHTFAAWRTMSDEKIAAMDGKKATEFYPTLIGIIDLLCKDREVQEVANV